MHFHDITDRAPQETRYDRQTLVAGWDQAVLRRARVLVVGAGALGCEVIKNLALSGVGHIGIADFDIVELTNLSRCVLYGDNDLGRHKAIAASESVHRLNPELHCAPVVANIEYDLGAGALRGYDLVLGAVDTIAARLAIGRLCRQAGVSWIDGGMDARGGQVSFYEHGRGPCYRCGMTAGMWTRVAESGSCLALGSGAKPAEAKMAATVTMASTIGAIQAQEAIRWLLRGAAESAPAMEPGQRICIQSSPYAMYVLHSALNPECSCGDPAAQPHRVKIDVTTTTANQLMELCGASSIALDWDVVAALECFGCSEEHVAIPFHSLHTAMLRCERCGKVRVPHMQSQVERDSSLAAHTLAGLGVPAQATLQLRDADNKQMLIELAADTEKTDGSRQSRPDHFSEACVPPTHQSTPVEVLS